jgi:hypothetical protein
LSPEITGQANACAKALFDRIDRLMQPTALILVSERFGSSHGIKERIVALMNRNQTPLRRLAQISWGAVISVFVTVTYAAIPRTLVPSPHGSVEFIAAVKAMQGMAAFISR